MTINGNIIPHPDKSITIINEIFDFGGNTYVGNITVNGNVDLSSIDEFSTGGTVFTNNGIFTVSGNLIISPGMGFISNKGEITIGGDLLGSSTGDDWESIFVNEGLLKIGGNIFPAAPNLGNFGLGLNSTVEYFGNSHQTIFNAWDETFVPTGLYHNLIISNSSIDGVTIASNIQVSNDFEFSSKVSINSAASLTIDGSWQNNGGYLVPDAGTVIFNGTNNQTVGGLNKTDFHNLIIRCNQLLCDFSFIINGNLTTEGDGRFNFNSGKVTFSNQNPANIDVNENSSFFDLELSGESVAVDSYLNIKNDLALNTNIIGNGLITLGYDADNPGNLIYSSGIISAEFRRWIINTDTYVMPIGINDSYRGVEIKYDFDGFVPGLFSSAFFIGFDYGVNGIYTGMPFYCGEQLIDNIYDIGGWRLNALNGLQGSFDIGFHTQDINEIVFPDRLRIVKRPSDGSTGWSAVGSHGGVEIIDNDAKHYVVKRNGLSGFSDFALGSDFLSNPLPIEFVSFNIGCFDNYIKASWTTASEVNNSFFTLERSKDMRKWEFVSTVNGMGTSSQGKNYSVKDYNYTSDINYYKLSQTDFDGTVNLICINSFSCSKQGQESIQIHNLHFSNNQLL